jgi:excisionase family DNA binding protein
MSEMDLMGRGALTPRQVSEQYGIPRSRLFGLIRDGILPRVRLSARRILVPRAAIEQYLAQHLVTSQTA